MCCIPGSLAGDILELTTQPYSAPAKPSSCTHNLASLVTADVVSLIGDVGCSLHSLELYISCQDDPLCIALCFVDARAIPVL